MSHTPGPWEWSVDVDYSHFNVIARDTGGVLSIAKAFRQGDGLPIRERECNARLIAAAPDLLAACNDYLAYRHGANLIVDDIAARMTAAVAKTQPTPNGDER
jgi:hypothetical protein